MKLFTHYNIGDHLICYGFVKEFSKQYDTIILTTKDDPRQLPNAQRLFSSIKNVFLTTEHFPNNEYDKIISSNWWFQQVSQWYQYPTPKVPFYLGEEMIFDRFWYKLADVPFKLKWDNFYLERNLQKEKEIYYDIIGLKNNEEYTFLHEDPFNTDEDRSVKRKYINPDIRLINMTDWPDISILDTAYLIENAKEIHVINSSFRTFIDLMNIKNNNVYYHMYTRSNPAEQVAVRLKWNTLIE